MMAEAEATDAREIASSQQVPATQCSRVSGPP